jgi:tyrosyl-tRNA synthetase
LDFLRDAGKNLTVSYMLSKESVKKRLETGLSFTEFSYQLLQAYDFLTLYQQQDCKIQMGGSDQWGNITSGTEFIRRNTDGKAYAVTTPLLTKSDGSKFGKSEKGNIWLSPKLTSPYEFYQFWVNASDQDLPKYFRYFSFKSKAEIEALEAEHKDNPNALKRIFAEEITSRVHSVEAFESAHNVSNIIFTRSANHDDMLSLDCDALATIAKEIPSFSIQSKEDLSLEVLATEHTNIFNSKSEFRRAIKSNCVSINKQKISDPNTLISTSEWLEGQYLLVENGKKNKFMITVIK